MIQFEALLGSLKKHDVSFVIIGGVAATLHGSARLTNDLDVVYERASANLERMAAALAPFEPYLRGAPAGLPFRLDPETLKRGLNFTLRTTAGDIDLLGELTGVGVFKAVYEQSLEVRLFDAEFRFINLDALIRSKRAAGRAKDLEVVAELETIRDERSRQTEKPEA
jgi:predicted nucleotidyltransferase